MLTSQPETTELSGRVALVTGAARGQGRAIALRLASAGATVVAGDVLEEPLEELLPSLTAGGLVGRLDVRDPDSWSLLVDRAVERLGQIDILINNAGVLRRMSLDDETDDGFESTWRVNCFGPFLGMRTLLPHLRRSHHGAIVNTSSVAGLTAWSSHAAYVSSKWAVTGLTRAAALELAADGIRVNAVVPGPIDTPMLEGSDDPLVRSRLSAMPLGRMGTVEDIAEAVLFLVSDRSAYITGSEIVVDGGQRAGTVFAKGSDRSPRAE